MQVFPFLSHCIGCPFFFLHQTADTNLRFVSLLYLSVLATTISVQQVCLPLLVPTTPQPDPKRLTLGGTSSKFQGAAQEFPSPSITYQNGLA